MILASAVDTILGSPVVAVILSGFGAGLTATTIGVFRLLGQFRTIVQRVGDMDKVMNDMKQDLDVIKWGAVASYNVHRGLFPQSPNEGQ